MVNLGERLRKLRLEKHLTQTEMSRRIGVSKAMISSYELEQRQPSYGILVKFAAFFGVSADFLLGLERDRTINVKGLSDKEVEIINSMVEALRDK
uniref:Transcriptional regulator n=1 Tax=uncultured bacterium contig00081 TaxID=1181557 RepID=A0A806K0L7_9BACT|nr:transcriptional regulator [uncultured bacterium contig00081]